MSKEEFDVDHWKAEKEKHWIDNISHYMMGYGCPEEHCNASLEDFSTAIGASKLARRVIREDEYKKNCGLFISGEVGAGKTHLMCAVMTELVKSHQGHIHFVTVDNLLSEIKNSFGNPPNDSHIISKMTEFQLKKYYSDEVNYLFLDDLGSEQVTNWSVYYLDSLINARKGNLKPTFFTSNFTLSEIRKIYGERISSRIKAMCHLIRIMGKDKRKVPFEY